MKTLIAPDDTTQITVGDDTYHVEDGTIVVANSHVEAAKMHGFTDPDETPAAPGPVLPTVDPEIAADLAEALATENEGLKADVARLEADNSSLILANDDLRNTVQLRDADIHGLTESLGGAADAIGKLRTALTEAGGSPDTVLGATESPGETASSAAGADTTGKQGAASPDTFRLDENMPSFDDPDLFDRDQLVAWLKEHGVGAAGNISRATAEKLCIEKFEEMKAAEKTE